MTNNQPQAKEQPDNKAFAVKENENKNANQPENKDAQKAEPNAVQSKSEKK